VTPSGQDGIEQAYEKQLAGRPGGRIVITNAAGDDAVARCRHLCVAIPDQPVRTDHRSSTIQQAPSRPSPARPSAALVAMDPSTGDVLASVAWPRVR